MRRTNRAEAGAFFLARAITVAILFAVNPLLAPLYLQLFRTGVGGGGAMLVTIVSTSISVVAWLVTFLLFIALRGGFAGVPATVSARRNAVTSSGGEIGAYLIAALIALAAGYALNILVMARVYVSVRQSGGPMAVIPVSLGVSAVLAVVAFLIFVAVRSAMPASPAAADGPPALYDEGGASMGFGQAIATCFRKYAVFGGRASRSEYWFFVLFEILLYIALMIADLALFRGSVNVLSTLASLVLLLPGLAVLVRRLHDTDRSAWWILIPFVPLIGSIWLIVLLCQRGTEGANRYGMGPADAAIPEVFA